MSAVENSNNDDDDENNNHNNKNDYVKDDFDDSNNHNHVNNIATNTSNHSNDNDNDNDLLENKNQKLDWIDRSMLVLAGSSIFLFGGAYYGWGPMQLLLEDNGNFNSKCTGSEAQQEQEVCEEQTQALLNVRFYSQFTLFASPILGLISDKYGSTTICWLMSIFAIVGILLLIVASSSSFDLDWLLYVAFSCIGLASVGYGMMTVETGVVYKGPNHSRLRSRIISAMNSLYDAGAITYWILWGIGQLLEGRATLSQLASGYLVVAVLCLGGYWYMFRQVVIKRRSRSRSNSNNIEEQNDNSNHTNTVKNKRGELVHSQTATTTKEFDVSSRSEIVVAMKNDDNDETTDDNVPGDLEEKSHDPTTTASSTEYIGDDNAVSVVVNKTNANDGGPLLGSNKPPPTTTTVKEGEKESVAKGRNNHDSNSNSKTIPSTITEEEETITPATVTATTATPSATSKNVIPSNTDSSTYLKIADRPFREQIKSSLFLLLATFFSFHQASNVWTLTTARDFLKYLGDDETGNKYLTIFTLLTPVSLLGLPFVDIVLHKYGFHAALQCINILAIIHGTIKVSSENLNVQIVGFLVFSFFRCFLFAVSLSCLPTFVSADSTGRAVSALYCISGALCFLNVPFARLALDYGDGNFFLPNMLYLIMTFPMIVVTWQLGKKLKLDNDTQSLETMAHSS